MVPEQPSTTVTRPAAASRLRSLLGLAAVAALLVVSYQQVSFDFNSLFTGARDFFNFFPRLAPDFTAWPQIWPPLVDTIRIAYVATIIGTLIALPLIFLASLQHLPRTGESITIEGWKLEVVDMDGRRIDKILASPAAGEG